MTKQFLENAFSPLHIATPTHTQIIDVVHDSHGSKEIVLQAGASFSYLLLVDSVVLDWHIKLIGEASKLNFFVIITSSEKQVSQCSLKVQLLANKTLADVYILSLAGDDSSVEVDGNITLETGISGAEGYLLEENVILGERVHLKTLPVLEVKSDDVKASHGAKIDKLDPQKLFYMTSKGLDKTLSKKLILEGYLQNVFQKFDMFDEEFLLGLKKKILGRFFSK